MDESEHVQLGPYTLKQRIGAGGMAEVWMAERTMMGAHQKVAIKLLNAVSRESQQHREMFLDEARLSMALNHSSIVQVFDVAECAGECFITMQWVDGLNLAELTAAMWQQGERVPVHVSAYIIGEVLRALDHAHNVESHGSTGIVHRDISPQNVMISVGGEVKIMDFGVARFSTEHTTGTFLKGKLRYMAPEQANLQSRDPIIDLFAVGAIFYELVEGCRFRAGTTNDIELLNLAMTGSFPPLTTRAELPPQLVTVIDGLLEANPSLRIGSARGALRMLSEWDGYRNAALELEAIVARHRGRTSSEAPAATSVSAARQIKARMAAHLTVEGPSQLESASWRGVNASTETSLERLDSDAIDETSVGSIWARRTTRATRGAAVAVGLLALALGSTTVWFAVDRGLSLEPVADEEATAVAAATNPEAQAQAEFGASPEPEPESEPESDPAPEPERASDAPAKADEAAQPEPPSDEAQLELELEPEPDPTPEPEPAPPLAATAVEPAPAPEPAPKTVKQPKQKVTATFVAGAWRFVSIKVGSREYTLQPSKAIELKEGRHRVKIFDREQDEWVKAGSIRLSPGHSYEVHMLKPAGVKLIELD